MGAVIQNTFILCKLSIGTKSFIIWICNRKITQGVHAGQVGGSLGPGSIASHGTCWARSSGGCAPSPSLPGISHVLPFPRGRRTRLELCVAEQCIQGVKGPVHVPGLVRASSEGWPIASCSHLGRYPRQELISFESYCFRCVEQTLLAKTFTLSASLGSEGRKNASPPEASRGK